MKNKVINKSIWGVVEYIWYPMLTIISTPIILKSMGYDNYGLWVLLNTLIAITTMFIGGNSYGVQSIRIEKSKKTIFKTCLYVSLINGLTIFIIIYLINIACGELIFGKLQNGKQLESIILFLPILLFLEIFDGMLAGYIKGLEKYELSGKIEITIKTILILCVIYLSNQHESYSVIVALVGVNMIRVCLKTLILFKDRESSEGDDKIEIGKFYKMVGWGYVQGSTGLLFTVLDKLIVGNIFGLKAIGIYGICIQLSSQIHAVIAAGLNIIQPRVINLLKDSKGDTISENKRNVFIANIMMSSIMLFIILIFGCYYFNYIGLDTGDVNKSFYLACISFYLLSLNISSYYYLVGVGEIMATAKNSIYASLILVLTIVLYYPLDSVADIAYARIAYALVTLILIRKAYDKKDLTKNI